MAQTLQPAPGGEASYATLARLLTAFYAIEPPLDPRQVHAWHKRSTKNKAGQPFPAPARDVPDPKRGQPHHMFSARAVLEWYEPGVPGPNGKDWRVPGE